MKQYCRLGFALFVLSACSPAPPVPDDHYYGLPDPIGNAAQLAPDGIILVHSFEANGLHRERAVIFSEDEQGLELRQHHYHFWQDAPPRLLQHQLVALLRTGSAARMVVSDPEIEADLTISGRVVRWERQLGVAETTARVALELRLDRGESRQPVLVRTYSADVAAGGIEVRDSIGAFARATNLYAVSAYGTDIALV